MDIVATPSGEICRECVIELTVVAVRVVDLDGVTYSCCTYSAVMCIMRMLFCEIKHMRMSVDDDL